MNFYVPKLKEMMNIFVSEEQSIRYLLEKDVIKDKIRCECGNILSLKLTRKSYRCYTQLCRKEISMFRNTALENRNLKANDFLLLAYLWICETPQKAIMNMSQHSQRTLTNTFFHFREIVKDALTEEDSQIGGENIIVEIDESKFGERKYNRGHHVEGVWIIGGVERTPARNLFLKLISQRNAETLLDAINAHVRPGSIIYTDGWRGYNMIQPLLNMEHSVVNHSLHFVNPVNGHHTNTIEGTWSGIKRKIPVRNRTTKIEPHLFEFIWRRKNKNDIWNSFISLL